MRAPSDPGGATVLEKTPMSRFAAAALVAAMSLFAQGCATITRGTTQAWIVESDPIGAEVELSSGERCRTPCTLEKKRKHAFTVTITKAGYEPVQTQVLSAISGAGATGMAGNVLVGGIIGIGIDAGSGATKDLRPNPLVVKLVPNDAAPIAAPIAPAPIEPAQIEPSAVPAPAETGDAPSQ